MDQNLKLIDKAKCCLTLKIKEKHLALKSDLRAFIVLELLAFKFYPNILWIMILYTLTTKMWTYCNLSAYQITRCIYRDLHYCLFVFMLPVSKGFTIKTLNSGHLRVLRIFFRYREVFAIGRKFKIDCHIWDYTICPLFMACPLFGMSAIGRFHCINICLKGTLMQIWKSANIFVCTFE